MRSLYLLFWIILFAACKDDYVLQQQAVEQAIADYHQSPGDQTYNTFIQARKSYFDSYGHAEPEALRYILEGARIAWKRGNQAHAFSGYQSLLNQFPDHPERADHLVEMISFVETFDKPELSQVMYKSFINSHSTHPSAAAIQEKITHPHVTADSMINLIDLIMYDNADHVIDAELGQLYIEMCETSVLIDTTKQNGAEQLLRAAQVARIAKLHHRALKQLTWLRNFYPEHPLASTALLFKGYIYDHDLKRPDAAKEAYNQYLKEDPYGKDAELVLWLLNNMGKTEKELESIFTPDSLRKYM